MSLQAYNSKASSNIDISPLLLMLLRCLDASGPVLAGVGDGITLGTPICIMVPNTDQKSQDYTEMAVAYRPSHADATYDMKYGIRAVSPAMASEQ